MLDIIEFNKRYGWFTQEEGEFLYSLALDATTILEVGCWEGRSTYALCQAVADNMARMRKHEPWWDGSGGTVFTVDHFLGVPGSGHNDPGGVYANLNTDRQGVIEKFLSNTCLHRDLGIHFLIEEHFDSVYHALTLLFRHTPLDLAFIDDDHSYIAVKRRIEQCTKLLRPGGILCGHDYRTKGNEGVKQAVDLLLPDVKVAAGTSIWHWQKPV